VGSVEKLDATDPIAEFSTLVDILLWRAFREPEQRIFTFLLDGEEEADHLTHAVLDERARSIAAQLQGHGAAGERALLLYPAGLEFITAFFGCLYAGVIAVPLPPPNLTQPQRSLPRLRAIINDCQPSLVLTTSTILANAVDLFKQAPELRKMRWLTTDKMSSGAVEWRDPGVTRTTLALLQYTSGSTAEPKGVMIRHGNLLHNSAYIHRLFAIVPGGVTVTWLPALFGPAASDHGRRHEDVFLAAMVVERQLERRQQDHVQRRALGHGKRPQPPRQVFVQREIQLRAMEHLNRRSRPIRPQVEHGQRAGQLLPPVFPEPFAGRTRQHLGLPTREIRVSQVESGEIRRAAGSLRRIQRAEFIQDHGDGPEIDGDVMNDKQQHMFVSRSGEQVDPHDRPSLQIERALGFRDQAGLQRILVPGRGIGLFELHRLMLVDLLNGLAGLYGKSGPQGRMAIDECLEGAPESRDI
jgi:hypothetical protein